MTYKSKYANDNIDFLFEAILELQTQEECHRFFEDLSTIQEIKEMALRFKVASLLDCKTSYQIISRETGASTATISRINKSLQYGANGYSLVLDRMKTKKE
ncbi:MAG: hypothetical protein KJ971_03815 [Firmicutes bacterium]|nr:hypothetical protein [Bacillota bacterium]